MSGLVAQSVLDAVPGVGETQNAKVVCQELPPLLIRILYNKCSWAGFMVDHVPLAASACYCPARRGSSAVNLRSLGFQNSDPRHSRSTSSETTSGVAPVVTAVSPEIRGRPAPAIHEHPTRVGVLRALLESTPDIPAEIGCRQVWSVMSLAGRMVPIVDLGWRVGRLDRRERLEDLVGVHGVAGNDPAVAGASRTIWPSLCSSARPEITYPTVS